jgi:hypothetical protein
MPVFGRCPEAHGLGAGWHGDTARASRPRCGEHLNLLEQGAAAISPMIGTGANSYP